MPVIAIFTTLLSQNCSILIEGYMFTPPQTYSDDPLIHTGCGVYYRKAKGLKFVNKLSYSSKSYIRRKKERESKSESGRVRVRGRENKIFF